MYEFFHPRFTSKLRSKYAPIWEGFLSGLGLTEDSLSGVNIERLFETVEPIWELCRDSQQARALGDPVEVLDLPSPIDILRTWIVDAIHLSTSWLRKYDCPLHQALAQRVLANRESIISFNYDLIMDLALVRTARWTIGLGYGWEDAMSRISDKYKHGISDCDTFLLKPHGSLNWFPGVPCASYDYVSGDYSENKLRRGRIIRVDPPLSAMDPREDDGTPTSPPYVLSRFCETVHKINSATTDQRRKFEKHLVEDKKSSTRQMLYEMKQWELGRRLPIVVVPSPYKSYVSLRYGELQLVWRSIPKLVGNVDEIVAIGFTFSDPHFNSILAHAIRGQKNPPQLIIVNPSMSTIWSIQERLKPLRMQIRPFCGTFADYANKALGCPTC